MTNSTTILYLLLLLVFPLVGHAQEIEPNRVSITVVLKEIPRIEKVDSIAKEPNETSNKITPKPKIKREPLPVVKHTIAKTQSKVLREEKRVNPSNNKNTLEKKTVVERKQTHDPFYFIGVMLILLGQIFSKYIGKPLALLSVFGLLMILINYFIK